MRARPLRRMRQAMAVAPGPHAQTPRSVEQTTSVYSATAPGAGQWVDATRQACLQWVVRQPSSATAKDRRLRAFAQKTRSTELPPQIWRERRFSTPAVAL